MARSRLFSFPPIPFSPYHHPLVRLMKPCVSALHSRPQLRSSRRRRCAAPPFPLSPALPPSRTSQEPPPSPPRPGASPRTPQPSPGPQSPGPARPRRLPIGPARSAPRRPPGGDRSETRRRRQRCPAAAVAEEA